MGAFDEPGDRRPEGAEHLRRLLTVLPGVVFVIDGMGRITFATDSAAEIVDQTPDELVGRSVLEFVTAESAWAYAAAVAMASDYSDVTVGPLRVALAPLPGTTGIRQADLWATNCLEDPLINGIVCLLTPETAAVWLGEAVEAASASASLSTISDHVVTAMRGHPVVADALLLAPSRQRSSPTGLDLAGGKPPSLAPLVPSALDPALVGGPGPWEQTYVSGLRSQWDVDELPEQLAQAASGQGYKAVWVEPVYRRNAQDTVAVLVLWRRRTGGPSPNQLSSIHQAASILRLCWTAG